MNDYIIAINRLKTDDLSNADSREIPATIVSKLFIQFDSTKVKNKLIELCEGIISFDLKYITQKTRTELIDKVNQEFNEHEIKFRKEPETQDEWKTLWDELKKAEAEKDDRFKKITGANDVVNVIIGGNQVNRPNEDLFKDNFNKSIKERSICIKKNTEEIWGAFIRKIQNTNISQDEDFQKFKEETIKSFDKFKQERY